MNDGKKKRKYVMTSARKVAFEKMVQARKKKLEEKHAKNMSEKEIPKEIPEVPYVPKIEVLEVPEVKKVSKVETLTEKVKKITFEEPIETEPAQIIKSDTLEIKEPEETEEIKYAKDVVKKNEKRQKRRRRKYVVLLDSDDSSSDDINLPVENFSGPKPWDYTRNGLNFFLMKCTKMVSCECVIHYLLLSLNKVSTTANVSQNKIIIVNGNIWKFSKLCSEYI